MRPRLLPLALVIALIGCHDPGEATSGPASASASATAATATTTATTTAATGESTTSATTTAATDTTGQSPGVDLALIEIHLDPPAPALDQPVALYFTVKNHGLLPLTAPVRLGVAIDGKPDPTLDLTLAGLPAGAAVTLGAPIPWQPPAAVTFQVAAIIDADDLIDEADEADNYAAIDVDVAAPASACRTLEAWSASEPFADQDHPSHPLPSFASGGWYYVHTQKIGGGDRVLYAAKPGRGGALAPWQLASADHGGGPHGFTAIDVDGEAFHFRNGHIARFPLVDGVMQGDVVLLEDNPDTAFAGNKYVWDSAVYAPVGAGHIIHLGGFSFTGYTYEPDVMRSPVPVAPAFTDTGLDHPHTRPGKSAFYAPPGLALGHLFTGESGGPRLWRGQVAADGALTGWQQLADLPPGTDNERGDLFIAGATLFAVRGARVYRADIADDGALAPWIELPALPEPQIDITWGDGHLEGAAYGLLGDHVYLTGPRRVFHARLQPTPCAR